MWAATSVAMATAQRFGHVILESHVLNMLRKYCLFSLTCECGTELITCQHQPRCLRPQTVRPIKLLCGGGNGPDSDRCLT